MSRRTTLLMVTAVFVGVWAAPAAADQSPPGCSANGLVLTITKDTGGKSVVRNGDIVTYGVWISNNQPGSCDITGMKVSFAVPGPDGQPSTSPQSIVAPQSLPAGTAPILLATVPYTVSVDPAAFAGRSVDLEAKGHADGVLHDSPTTNHAASIDKTLGTDVTLPSMVLTKTGSTLGGVAPQTVTYVYTLQNTSTTVVPIANVSATDNLCSPLTYVSGDANGNGLLENGEKWAYSCTKTYAAAGTYTNVVTATGTSTVDNRPVNAGPAQWTVTVTAPAPPPPAAPPPGGGGVQGASGPPSTQPCVKLAHRSVNVRAHEMSTVQVRVRLNGRNIARSLVHLRGPGVKRSGRTNKLGVVTFHVRPTKSGRLMVSSDQCTVAARVSVKPARRVVAPVPPEVTG